MCRIIQLSDFRTSRNALRDRRVHDTIPLQRMLLESRKNLTVQASILEDPPKVEEIVGRGRGKNFPRVYALCALSFCPPPQMIIWIRSWQLLFISFIVHLLNIINIQKNSGFDIRCLWWMHSSVQLPGKLSTILFRLLQSSSWDLRFDQSPICAIPPPDHGFHWPRCAALSL